MLTIISPAKSLDFESVPVATEFSQPEYLSESEKLIKKLRKIKPAKLRELMNISASLANLNYERFQLWQQPFTMGNAKQAVLAFNGEVYNGLQAASLSPRELSLAQDKLRILSGLYGILRPLDLIQPYRLEMGIKWNTGRTRDLYDFWRPKVTKSIRQALEGSGSPVIVNLASNEYFSCIDLRKINTEIITPTFKDKKNGDYKSITIYMKKARGQMVRFIIENNLQRAEDLQAFTSDGYYFNPRLSEAGKPVFTRD